MAELILPLIAAFVLAYVTSLPKGGPASPDPVPTDEAEVPDED